jgi:hypothetical protein
MIPSGSGSWRHDGSFQERHTSIILSTLRTGSNVIRAFPADTFKRGGRNRSRQV